MPQRALLLPTSQFPLPGEQGEPPIGNQQSETSNPPGPADVSRLLLWYRANRRDLPWRRTSDPWAILVSEVMLQQTTVSAVIPYFESFLKLFHDPWALAAAPLEDVLAAWSGLGYYRRARNLKAAAAVVSERHEGNLPSDLEGLRALPGVGEYTAAAVGSIAFGIAEPVLDSNVQRVLARVLGIGDDPRRGEALKRVRAAARGMLPREHAGDFNQAMMELGATVCTPLSPACTGCPLSTGCEALRRGIQEQIPPPRKTRDPVRHDVGVALLRRADRRILLVRRSAKDRLANMWELPGTDWEGPPDARLGEAQAVALAAEQRTGAPVAIVRRLGVIRHTITHRRIWCQVYLAEARTPIRRRKGLRWVLPEEAGELGVSSLVTKALAKLGARN